MRQATWRSCLPDRVRRCGVDAPSGSDPGSASGLTFGATNRHLADWLREPASLTARLQRCGTFRVALLQQRAGRANADELAAFGLDGAGNVRRRRFWVREVVLHSKGVPVVFAHTVLPVVPRGVLSRWFARLGSRSLGSLLFAHPGFRRGPLRFAAIVPGHPLYAPAASALGVSPAAFQARRCVHRFRSQRVLVTEVFSPEIGHGASAPR